MTSTTCDNAGRDIFSPGRAGRRCRCGHELGAHSQFGTGPCFECKAAQYTPAPCAKDSETSAAAAESMEPVAGTLRGQILGLLRNYPPGFTCEELELALKLRHQTTSPRLWEMQRQGLVRQSDARRKTTSGRLAVVWVAEDES